MRALWVALQFLTRLPVPPVPAWAPDTLARSLPAFPVVGAALGMGLGLVYAAVCAVGLPALPGAVLAGAIVGPLLTGALHEDGLGDTADGLFGSADRERTLEIFRDSRVGAYAVVAIVGVVLLRVSLLAELRPVPAIAALALAHGLGRTATVAVMARLPYARSRDAGVGAELVAGLRPVHAAGTFAAAAVVAVLAAPFLSVRAVVLAAGSSVVLTVGFMGWLRRRLGGTTGDTLGAACILVEVGVLGAVVVALA